MLSDKRLTIFVGHYGSGKTSLALDHAKVLNEAGNSVVIADMDIVNPYFRTADSRDELQRLGIELVCSAFAGTNLDVPALPKELYAAIGAKEQFAVLDVGGDDSGAVALGRYAPMILTNNDYEMLFVVNFFRPLTTTPEEALTVLHEIEAAAGLRCTGLVNNSNIGLETRPEDVVSTFTRMSVLSRQSGLPIIATTAVEAVGTVLNKTMERVMIINAKAF